VSGTIELQVKATGEKARTDSQQAKSSQGSILIGKNNKESAVEESG
jgi:hypothetical protein